MKKLFSFVLICGALTSCSNHDALYDPSILQEAAKENFPVKNIDPNQDWNMATVKTVKLTIQQKVGENYTVKVYNLNPFNVNSNARILALKENVPNGTNISLSFDCSVGLNCVYVVFEDKNGGYTMQPYDLNTTSRFASRSNLSSRTITIPSTTPIKTPSLPDKITDEINNLPEWTGYAASGSYIMSKDGNINLGGTGNLYVKGKVTLTYSYLNSGANLIILPGAEVTLTSELRTGAGSISICKGATLIAPHNIFIEYQKLLYNLGTIETTNLTTNGGYFVNGEGGKVKVTNQIHLSSGNSVLENYSSINVEDFKISNGYLVNVSSSEFVVNNNTEINSGNFIKNEGLFSTTSMNINSSGVAVYNSCRFYVTKKLNFICASSRGTFIIDGGAYTEINDLAINNAEFILGGNSFLNVTNEATLDTYNKIQGTDNGYSIFKAKKVISSRNNQRDIIAYSGNLYIDCNNHVEQQVSGGTSYTTTDNVKFIGGSKDYVIQKSECNPGYNAETIVIPDNYQYYTYAFEDMFKEVGDYDFNDVIVKVSTVPINGKIKVKLSAAGAIKPLYVYYNNKSDNVTAKPLFEGKEVHTAFGKDQGVMINTGEITAPELEEEISVGNNFSVANDLDVYIKGKENVNEIHIPKFVYEFAKGDVPYALCVTADWEWPVERQSIISKYPVFEKWAQDVSIEDYKEWWK